MRVRALCASLCVMLWCELCCLHYHVFPVFNNLFGLTNPNCPKWISLMHTHTYTGHILIHIFTDYTLSCLERSLGEIWICHRVMLFFQKLLFPSFHVVFGFTVFPPSIFGGVKVEFLSLLHVCYFICFDILYFVSGLMWGLLIRSTGWRTMRGQEGEQRGMIMVL